MKYFFILGSNPTLSAAELTAVFGPSKRDDSNDKTSGQIAAENVFLSDVPYEIDALNLIRKLGGTVKLGKISDNQAAKYTAGGSDLTDKLSTVIMKILTPEPGKFKFGISCYGRSGPDIKKIAMTIKKNLRERSVSSRWVTSREPTLSSVVVEQNKLTGPGIEIVIIEHDHHWLVGRTLAVQPFKELSFRDYGRPARDDRSGMLPPKLAQIMINLAVPRREAQNLTSLENTVLLDPFCGSGTILTEAMLMGYKNLIGVDISEKAIGDTATNVEWTGVKFRISDAELRLYNQNATGLSKFMNPDSVDAIVTEPYLGPQRGKYDVGKTTGDLEKLYSLSLSEFRKVLKSGGRIVMVWPVFTSGIRSGQPAFSRVEPDIKGLKIVDPIPLSLRSRGNIETTDRNTIVYGRPGQKVRREIIVLEKIQRTQ